LICVGYHYVKTDNADAQAACFANNGGGARVMFDFEANSGGINNYWACVQAFNRHGIEVVLSYIPHWYWQGTMGSPDISSIPGLLIQSRYVNGSGLPASVMYPGDNSPWWAGFGGKQVDILQFTDAARVAGMNLDCNAYRGTKAQLAAALGIGGIVEDDMTGEEHDKLFQVWGALFNPTESWSKYHTPGEPGTPNKDKVSSIDAMSHEALVERNALLGNAEAKALVKREADKGDKWAQVVYSKCP
jgi:hypothetical protein